MSRHRQNNHLLSSQILKGKQQHFDSSLSPFFAIKLATTKNHVNTQFGESRAKIYSDIALKSY